MKKNDYLTIEIKTLNLHAEDIFRGGVKVAEERAQKTSNRTGKAIVLVKVIAVFVPQTGEAPKNA